MIPTLRARRYTQVYKSTSFRQGLPESTTARMQEVEQRRSGCREHRDVNARH